MRLEAIQAVKARVGAVIPVCSPADIGDLSVNFRIVSREPLRRRLMRAIAPTALVLRRRAIESSLRCSLSFAADGLCFEERFGDDASKAALLQLMAGKQPDRVLIPGCFLGGEDVQFWLRRGTRRLDGVDLNNLGARWSVIVPELRRTFGADVHFQQAPLEQLPFPNDSFDVIASAAVLEHVQNLEAVSAESARVLKRGGLAWHSFGPLYFSFGADHCIDAYGDECGYDHLLLTEEQYLSRVSDQAFFDRQPNPNLPFWARHDQFSFAFAREYLATFRKYFHVRHVVAKISGAGLRFRAEFPDKWQQLRAAGIAEEDLLVKGLSIVLQKRNAD
ncbi:MAG: hypothetical protein DLM73_14485 [Chthoniobacterales bacterium]|nr:MAG: hypothetical protein DLM73_14485 [Chthoniobacterales bacterium]